ncbi:MAG: carboxymuconolactone decarboxylase family protein [Fusobacteria bacterium]|nr:carboxymuconolactone decarboxylase family protein [Fusobacteriota bacterium]
MSQELYEKGIKKIQEFTRSHSKDMPTGEMEIGEAYAELAPDLPRYVVEFAFGEIYSRAGLDNKQKVLVTISSLVSQGMPQIAIHINSGLNVGLTPEEIVGAIVHLLPYTGFPKVLNALNVAKKIFEERDQK